MPIDDVYSTIDNIDTANGVAQAGLGSLLEQVAEQDAQAFHELYQRTSGQLFAVLLRLLKTSPAAEQALQKTYVQIWHDAAAYHVDVGAPLLWMTALARNRALDILRSNRNRYALDSALMLDSGHGPILSPDDEPFPADEDPSGSTELQVNIDESLPLFVCLEMLEQDQRNCISKAYCEGFSHEDLSLQMASPLSTVKSSIRKGLLTLQECLDELT